MLVADWARRRISDGDDVAWLTVEGVDDRPFEFWSALLQACAIASDDAAAVRLRAMTPPRRDFDARFIVAIAQAIGRTSLGAVVLDDVHRLHHPAVLAGLDLLLTEMPPATSIILLSRSAPRISLHARVAGDSYSEVSGADLAFTLDEAVALFERVTDRIEVSDVSRLLARTEGWAVGLGLAAFSMRSVADPAVLIDMFEGSDHRVADYLFAEIIQKLSAERYEFLLATCVPRQLTVELAAHLSGRDDAGEELDELCRLNALVTQSDDGSCYRYHSLLRSYLIATLNRRDISGLRHQHVRSALWFENYGDPASAIAHAFSSRDGDLLNDLLSHHGPHLILCGQSGWILSLVGAPPRSGKMDPRIILVAALAALEMSEPDMADAWLGLLADRDPFPEDLRSAALLSATIVLRSLFGGDVSTASAQTTVLDVPPTGDSDVDLIVLTARPPCRMRTGDFSGAVSDLEKVLRIATAREYQHSALYAISQLAGMHGALCEWGPARYWARRAIEFARSNGWGESVRLAHAHLVAAWTAFQTGDSAELFEHSESGARALVGAHNVEIGIGLRSLQALSQFDRGSGAELAEAAASVHQIWERTSEVDQVSPALISQSAPQEIRVCLLTGHIDWAEAAADRTRRRLPGSVEAVLTHAQVLAARGRAEEAVMHLRECRDGRVAVHAATATVTADVLAAVLENGLGNHQRSFVSLESALERAAPHSFRRPFLDAWDDVRPLLAAHRGRFGGAEHFVDSLFRNRNRSDVRDSSPADRALTHREQCLLRDLPAMLTLREIAEARGISENTVKTHVRSIYRKLGINNRASAVRKARERGLL
ncbi:LuxR C-terminal-related transcriptional regulator [Brachybacterium saurashtrense]|uniref:HTH luxR-type domain-containing protein n=1 Tax=Brachybacterium saurashtrense TaxID=556288 RepID=A0A345YLX0_9MICO|nr:LuxR C-terminal-related transcriptional regulator [Brachybacterium saurashtrense]AXK44922.1 hypothetical protein DWV08_04390 [Brachybacterium saurashtrense]RRR21606.1 hypothetical protein DXU92_12965 [Brachybacterium saurashtrense]